MPRKPKPTPDDPEQSKRFIDMAREIGADATKGEFERAFKKVAKRKSHTKNEIVEGRPVRPKTHRDN
jgi:hypothetical protein